MKKTFYLILGLFFICSCKQEVLKSRLIYQSQNFQIFSDSVSWKEYSAKIHSSDEISSTFSENRVWKRTRDISGYPEFHSDIVLLDAMHNMSLEELEKLKTNEGLFNTGALWGGVWTRDYSESIILSLSYLTPDIARRGLMRKTKKGMIIQDTGTGGSWPVSTDRMIWTIAAWEVYKVTGDKHWLDTIFPIIKKTAERDMKTAFSKSGLVYGETTTMDWRENSYPLWMKSVEIFQSLSLSTNAVHYKTYEILGEMARILNQPSDGYCKIAESIKQAINKSLWIDSLGYYDEFLYGKNYPMHSKRSDAIGEAFCVLFGIAGSDQAASIIRNTPVVEYGIPLFYPYKPDAFAYHNNTVWPYVQAVWNLAAAREENEEVLNHGLASVYRAAAIFLSNKENFVASTGNAFGTAMNSDRQLWSVAGNLAMTYRIFFGMQFETDKLIFHPVIPKNYIGKKYLKNFKYRNAILEITVNGVGSKIKSFKLDNTVTDAFSVPCNIKGNHSIEIEMEGNNFSKEPIKISENKFSPQEPELKDSWFYGIYWNTRENDKVYNLYENGKLISKQKEAFFKLPKQSDYREYQVEVVDKNNQISFLSNPVIRCSDSLKIKMEIEDFAPTSDMKLINFSGKGYVETNVNLNNKIRIPVTINIPGKYIAYIKYSNANGQMCCLDKCAVRSLIADGVFSGAFLFPIIEGENWSAWGESNTLQLNLNKGQHVIEINYLEQNENMNVLDNRAVLDCLCLVRIGY